MELSQSAAPAGIQARIAAMLDNRRNSATILFCIVAALCSTYLSGINFPEQNNRWQIPVVLDFAGSAEGPHDAYAQTFSNFISLFWILVRSVTNENTIEPIFVAIQLAGNALLACAILALLRRVSNAPWHAALVTGFLCFCYGLWGPTQLGYSEIFVTYATHTQYAIALCLFSLALIMANRPLWAAVLLGLAANINLFMAIWGALAVGVALVGNQRRVLSRKQIGFSLLFLAIAGPVTLWGLSANGGDNAIPVAFFRTFLAGHIYGLNYPRALVQTFALAFLAGLAGWTALKDKTARDVGITLFACTAVLAVGTIMPYLTSNSLLLLLHPLRFASIPILLAAVCAGALFLDTLRDRSDHRLFAATLALAGFMLKLPVVSLFGFALLIPNERATVRSLAFLFSIACSLALFLPSPEEVPGKAALAFLMVCAILTAVALFRPEGAPLRLRLAAAALGGVASVQFSPIVGGAILFAVLATILCFAPHRWHRGSMIAAGAAALLLLAALRDDLVGLSMIGPGFVLVVFVPMMNQLPHIRPLARAALVALVPALMMLGLLNGALNRFSPAPTAQQRDFLTAQHWARANTPRDALFLPIGVEDGFSLFSRRPVWWERSQGAAVLWRPSFLTIWARRRSALDTASTPQEMLDLSRREGISYLVVSKNEEDKFRGTTVEYENAHFSILKVSKE